MNNKDQSFFDKIYKKLETEKANLKPISEAFIEGREIMVSISCITYNHEKWISRALDSFLMQLVNFNVEIIVHDDASTDNTANIVREYEKKYPHVIKGIYEKDNQYSKKNGAIPKIVRSHIKGKYKATCEGDDYWIDSYKLYLQFNALELNKESHFCVHRVRLINVLDDKKSGLLPYNEYGDRVFNDITFIDLVNDTYLFHTSSFFCRSSDYYKYIDYKPKYVTLMNGDESSVRYYGSLGDTIYFNRIMSVYEMCLEGSWSYRRLNFSQEDSNEHLSKHFLGIMEFNKWANYKYDSSNRLEIKRLLQEEKYSDIINIKIRRVTLKKMNRLLYYKIFIIVKRPAIYAVLKIIKKLLCHKH